MLSSVLSKDLHRLGPHAIPVDNNLELRPYLGEKEEGG